jgi:hypothetical protein
MVALSEAGFFLLLVALGKGNSTSCSKSIGSWAKGQGSNDDLLAVVWCGTCLRDSLAASTHLRKVLHTDCSSQNLILEVRDCRNGGGVQVVVG